MLDYDEILDKIGGFGLYQRLMTACICVIYIPLGYFVFSSVFVHLTPEHRCKIPEIDKGSESIFDFSNLSHYLPLNHNLPGVNYSRCSRYVSALPSNYSTQSNNSITQAMPIEKCLDGWIYMENDGRTSCVTEFDLVCGQGWKKPLLTTALIFGLMLGSFISGPLTDRFGRRPTTIATLLGSIVLLLLYSLLPYYSLIVVVIVLIGIDHIILYCSAFVLAQELASKKHRALVACCINVTYAVGYSLLPLVAYSFTDWRWIVRILGLFSLIYLPYVWFLPESPRWLMARGNSKESIKLLTRISKFNGSEFVFDEELKEDEVHLNEQIQTDSDEENQQQSEEDISGWVLVKNSTMRNRTLIICWTWNVTFFCYYVIGLNTSNLGGNNYVNCFLAAALEAVCQLTSVVVLQKFGRRTTLSCFLGLSGVFCGLTAMFVEFYEVTITLTMIGKFFASAAMGILYLFTAELYPTILRNTGIGIASVSSRFSGMAAPFLVYIGENSGKQIPFYVMSAVSLMTCFITMLLPETGKSSLPDSFQDALDLENNRISRLSRKRKDGN